MADKTRLDELKTFVQSQGWRWTPGKPIQYGQQIVVTYGQDQIPVTFYDKRGVLVVGGSDSLLKAALVAWNDGKATPTIAQHPSESVVQVVSTVTRLDLLKKFIQDQGWHWGPGTSIPYGEQIVVSYAGVTALVNFWPKRGKIDVQGSDSPLKATLRTWATGTALGASTSSEPTFDGPHIGMDESGKGDWFGPLVVAAVYVDESTAAKLRRIGVRDSKELSAEAILRLAGHIERTVRPEQRFLLALDPAEYNQRYARHGNINLLLAEVYAEAGRQVWQSTGANTIVCDQFAQSEQRLEAAFAAAGLPRPEQLHEAESASIAVAAASILAGAAFAEALVQLGQQAGLGEPLPKGASEVERLEAVARQIMAAHETAALHRYAKVHFKPVKALLGDTAPAPTSNQPGSLLRPGPPITITMPSWEEAYHPEGFWVFHFRDGGVLNWYDATTGMLYMAGKPNARSFQLLNDKVKGKKWTKDIEDVRKAIRRYVPEIEEISIPSVLGLGWRRRETVLGGRFDFTDGAVLNYYSGKGTLVVQGKPQPLTETVLNALPSPYPNGWDALADTLKQLFPDWRLAPSPPGEDTASGLTTEAEPWSPLDGALDWKRFWPEGRSLRVAPNEKAPCQRALVEDWASVLAGHQGKRHMLAHAPTGLGKTLAALVPALAWVAQAPDRRRIYYLVNRVSQHVNPLRELRAGLAELFQSRTGTSLRLVDIVNQSLLCDHPQASTLASSCRQARDTASFALPPDGVASWREVKDHLAGQRCAYHTLQGLMAQAHVVICDYWWLFSQSSQGSGLVGRVGFSATESILIVDEAHNLPLRARAELDVDEPAERVAEAVGRASMGVRTCLKPVIAAVQASDPDTGMDVVALRTLAGGTHAVRTALDAITSARDDEPRLALPERMLHLLLQPDEAVVAYPTQDLDGKARLVFRLVDPTPVLHAGYSRVYASLSMSGTLVAPSDGDVELRYQAPLFGLPSRHTLTRKYASPFPLHNQRWIYNTNTCGAYRERSLHLMRYAEHIVGVGQTTSGVTAVFFSSYAFLEQVKAAIHDPAEQGLIVTEAWADAAFGNADASELSSYERRLRSLVSQHSRAYLFAVYQGKLAEGADFADNLIKSAICVSIPMEYPGLFHRWLETLYTARFTEIAEALGDDPRVKAHEYALDRHSLALVLQACGRGIRSKTDRCAFLLLDRRYHEYEWRRFLEPKPFNLRQPRLTVSGFHQTRTDQTSQGWDSALVAEGRRRLDGENKG